MGKFYQCIQSYGPSFMTKFCSALYLENLLTNIFAKLNLRGGVSCMPAALLFIFNRLGAFRKIVTCWPCVTYSIVVKGIPHDPRQEVPPENLPQVHGGN